MAEKLKSPVCCYTNEYGFEEWYEKFYIEHSRTAHSSSGEFDCGTCNGASCEYCREVWNVGELGITETYPHVHTISWWRYFNEKAAIERFNCLCLED